LAPSRTRCRSELRITWWGAASAAPFAGVGGLARVGGLAGMSGNEAVSMVALSVACLFAAAFLFRRWRSRRTRQPLVAAVVVLALGAGAVVLALLGVPYRWVIGPAFIVAMLAVLVSARTERRLR
jgi:peptidoglycan/LPS O-acetylase OafA/YrhL